MNEIARTLFEVADVRYVAIYRDEHLEMNQRPGIAEASASESDQYEELIVNPTLLKLVEQRGNIDCGGMQFVVIRYGNFFELVQAIPRGHISVGLEPGAQLDAVLPDVRARVATWIGRQH